MQENTVYVAQFTVGAIRAKVRIVVLYYAVCRYTYYVYNPIFELESYTVT